MLPADAGTHLPTPEGWKAELLGFSLFFLLTNIFFVFLGKTDDMPERGWVQALRQSVVATFSVSTLRNAQEAFPMANVHKP